MYMLTLISAFIGLYVVIRLILPTGMNWFLKLVLSLLTLAWAERLALTDFM